MNVITSVVRKGWGKKGSKYLGYGQSVKSPKRKKQSEKRGKEQTERRDRDYRQQRGKILDAFKREDTSKRRWRCKLKKK
jgi:hypothetical protein